MKTGTLNYTLMWDSGNHELNIMEKVNDYLKLRKEKQAYACLF